MHIVYMYKGIQDEIQLLVCFNAIIYLLFLLLNLSSSKHYVAVLSAWFSY